MLISLHLLAAQLPRPRDRPPIVCPPAAWQLGTEIQRFCPTEKVRRYHGPNRSLDQITSGRADHPWRHAARRRTVRGRALGLLVADEAQHVKNPRSGRCQAFLTILARSRVALTGTPVENNLSSSGRFWTGPLRPAGSLGAFREVGRPDRVEGVIGHPSAQSLGPAVPAQATEVRSGHRAELPPKTITDQPVELTPNRSKLMKLRSGEHAADPVPPRDQPPRHGAEAAHFAEADHNHPAQFSGRGTAGRAIRQSSNCSTNCSTPSLSGTARCWSSPSTWRWPVCCHATSKSAESARCCSTAVPR